MNPNSPTTRSFASPGQQQEFLRNVEAAALTPSIGFASNNPNVYHSNTAFVSSQGHTPWNPYYQQGFCQTIHRRGSLPLKKRRVVMLQEDHPYPLSFHRADGSGFRTIDSLFEYSIGQRDEKHPSHDQPPRGHYHIDHESLKQNPMNTSPFDKMNTLTLIAAAAAVNEAGRSPANTVLPNTVSFTPSMSSFDHVDQMRNPNTSFATSGRDDGSMDDSNESEDSEDYTSQVKHSEEHNTLTTSTSRSDRSKAVACQNHFRKSTAETSTLQECPSSCSSGQDKRFTGLSPHQVRCFATTTRGRPCTYAAVQSTKYCFLHADYDTNPPPRRIKSSNDEDRELSASSSLSPAAMINTEDDASDDEGRTSASPSSTIESKFNVESKVSASGVGVFKKRRTNAKFAEKHAESLRPLLSMMATDQWFGQSVQVAIGPFKGRTGIVQKWGNGWITVLIEGVGFHNRRSFELYLDAGTEDGNVRDSSKLTSTNSKKKKDISFKSVKEQDRLLFRCVSRDVVSPSPPATNSDNVKSSATPGSAKKSRAVTPKPSSAGALRHKRDESTPKKLRVHATSSIEIPETPLPQCISDGSETPIPMKSTSECMINSTMTISLPTAKVTPFSDRTTTATRSLTSQDRCNIDLQFPGHADDETKRATGFKSSNSSLVFRPSMGERTRGRASSHGGSHHRSQSCDSAD